MATRNFFTIDGFASFSIDHILLAWVRLPLGNPNPRKYISITQCILGEATLRSLPVPLCTTFARSTVTTVTPRARGSDDLLQRPGLIRPGRPPSLPHIE